MSIDLFGLTEDDVGRKVVYRSGEPQEEKGVISSWNTVYIFVKYEQSTFGIATRPVDLDFA